MSAVDPILERLMALHPKKIDLSLDRLERLLTALGNPERKLPPLFHVAGTNGKGSTVAYLRAMLEAAGYKVHVYTSPHLVRFAERIRLAGTLISDDALNALLEECEAANTGDPITFFEITTAAAFLAFSRTPADVLLLEVGLGGRLDATNVIQAPLVSVITPVSIDHVEFLGSNLVEIAAEKAGIAKSERPVVIAPQDADGLTAILEVAAEVDAIPLVAGFDWHLDGQDYRDWRGSLNLPVPALPGAHQIQNAALAVAALRAQSLFTVPDEAIAKGLQSAVWPARMQDISVAADRAPGTVWLDGGHNPAGAATIAALLAADPKPTAVILGMLANKDAAGYLTALQPHIDRLIAVPVVGEAAYEPDALAEIATGIGLTATTAPSWNAALSDVTTDRILICGSLYLAGQVLAELDLNPA
nr:folylpolyglutamate synthase/dihydrofolate synthase family protein [Govania unica]